MNAASFLDRIAARLGRARERVPVSRDATGPPDLVRTERIDGSLVERFARESATVGSTVHVVETVEDASRRLRAVIDEIGATRMVSVGRRELAGWSVEWLGERGCLAWEGGDDAAAARFRAAAADAQIGVTPVDVAVANSGTLVLTASPSRPRCVSLLPTVHVALLRADQIRMRLGDAMEEVLRRGAPPSSVLFVTGPSRTSDIENDLTIGVHGPAAVIVVVLNAPAAPTP